MRLFRIVLVFFLLSLTLAAQTPQPATPQGPPTLTEAQDWMTRAEAQLLDLNNRGGRASWVQETYITDDTEAISADANDVVIGATTRLIDESVRFDPLVSQMPPDLARKFTLLKLSLTMPAPRESALRTELTKTAAALDGDYGKSKYCPKTGPFAGKCLGQSEMEKAFATTTDPAVLQDLWVGWHSIGAPLKPNYENLVKLSNQGARELGYKDVGALWRAGYDMPPDQFTAEVHPVGAGAAAVRVVARLRAPQAGREVRAQRRAQWHDSCRPARQPVGAGVGQYLSDGCAAEQQTLLRSHRAAGSEEDAAARHGPLRRGFL
jgi:peptidyl-dipeptidase A